MKYEINLNKDTLDDELSANVVSIGFKGKRSFDSLKERLIAILKNNPLTSSKVVIENNKAYFESIKIPYVNFEQVKQSEKVWITNQYSIPFKMEEGELIRFALIGENIFVIYYHPLLSDSRGIVNFAKNILSDQEISTTPFYSPKVDDVKLSIFDKNLKKSLLKAKKDNVERNIDSVKLKSVSLKSDIVFRICSGERVTMLAFFVATALSLKKTQRKKITIPYCRKENNEDQLINDSTIFSFKRGFEPRLSFYENAGEIDKYFESIISKKSYDKRSSIIKDIPLEYLKDPSLRKKIHSFISSDLQFDILPTIDEDDFINTLSFYPSSSNVKNNFGISAVGDRITISTVVHDKESEQFFSDFSKTINLLSKEAAKRFKNI